VQILTLMTAVAAARAVTLKTPLRPRIKWPNDILINDKKVAGILLEGKTSSTMIEHAVVGIGLNVNQAPMDLPAELRPIATSLRIELGDSLERNTLICQVLIELENLYEKLRRGDASTVLEEWRSLSATLDRRVRILQRDKVTEGVAVGVATDGALVVRMENGSLNLFTVGDVEHLTLSGGEKSGSLERTDR
jgi:BirA family biotin operon repressor/biotin-[acetyl-CoA-carboxylase] ligase